MQLFENREWRMSRRPTMPDKAEPDDLLLGLGARIKFERRRRQMTQYDLAAASGAHQSTISAAESGDGEIRVSTLVRIAQAMELTIADLLPGQDKPAKGPVGNASGLNDLVERLRAISKEIKAAEQRAIRLRNATAGSGDQDERGFVD